MKLIEKFRGGLIVSCYAGPDFNPEMGKPEVMACVAQSCVAGGATAIRTNYDNVRAIKATVDVPVIGIKKVYQGTDPLGTSFRITPTLKEVQELVEAGADAIAIDGTIRERYDELTLKQFIQEIKNNFEVLVIADISTLEEGIKAWEYGADMIGTTLSGYTPYSKNPIVFGTVPLPEPDYQLIKELKENGVDKIVAEGRITNGEKMKLALEAGAYCVVIGTSITEPKKIVKTILYECTNKIGEN